MHAVRLAAALVLGLLVLATPAFGADAAAVKEKKDKALFAIGTDGDGLERARTVVEVAELGGDDGAKALVECVTAIAQRQTVLETIHLRTVAEYEPFKAYKLDKKQDGYWEKKKALLDRLDAEDERIQGLGVVAQATLAAIAKIKDADALAVLEKASAVEGDWHGRMIWFGGLVANPEFKAAELAKRAMKDDVAQVRVVALEGIAARKDPLLREAAEKALQDPGWPVRVAAVHALGSMKDPKSVPAIVAAMQTEDSGLLEQYSKTLTDLTGESLGHYPDAWRKWCDDHKDQFSGVKPAVAKGTTPKAPPPPVDYYGVQTISKRILFVIDISGSMKEPIGEAAEVTGVAKKEQKSGPKIEIAKAMLKDAITKLEKTTSFNIVWFNHEVGVFQEKMILATDDNKAKAQIAVDELQPAGATWALGALRKAFEFAGVTGAPVTGKFEPLVDTIFFLSDGAPTDESIDKAKLMEPKVILDAVREWNHLAKMQINTIAIDPRIGGGTMVRFMKALASDNGGTYTAIGAK